MTARICCACCSVVPWMLTLLMAATVMSTASLIALSAQASDCWLCICSAISCRRFWKSGSLKKPKPSMTVILPPARDCLAEREPRDDAGEDREPEREAAIGDD